VCAPHLIYPFLPRLDTYLCTRGRTREQRWSRLSQVSSSEVLTRGQLLQELATNSANASHGLARLRAYGLQVADHQAVAVREGPNCGDDC
jgi:hypothetical protein